MPLAHAPKTVGDLVEAALKKDNYEIELGSDAIASVTAVMDGCIFIAIRVKRVFRNKPRPA